MIGVRACWRLGLGERRRPIDIAAPIRHRLAQCLVRPLDKGHSCRCYERKGRERCLTLVLLLSGLPNTSADGGTLGHPPMLFKVLWGTWFSAGTAPPHLLKTSGARKSVVGVTGERQHARSHKSRLRRVLLNVRYAPHSDQVPQRNEMTRWAMGDILLWKRPTTEAAFGQGSFFPVSNS